MSRRCWSGSTISHCKQPKDARQVPQGISSMNFIINVPEAKYASGSGCRLTHHSADYGGDMPCERDPGADDNRQREWANAAGADPAGCVRRHTFNISLKLLFYL